MQVECYEVVCFQCETPVYFPIGQVYGSCKCGAYLMMKEWPEGIPMEVKVPVFDDDMTGREMKVGVLAI